jgi:uncharacterized membrane protein YbhN (UPF0104 family)
MPDRGSWQQRVPGRAYTAAALTLAAVATVIPLIPGIAAMVLARAGRRRGDPLGATAFVLSAVSIAVGFAVVAIAANLDVVTGSG